MTVVRTPEHVASEILDELIERMKQGDEIEITRDGETIARLAPPSALTRRPRLTRSAAPRAAAP